MTNRSDLENKDELQGHPREQGRSKAEQTIDSLSPVPCQVHQEKEKDGGVGECPSSSSILDILPTTARNFKDKKWWQLTPEEKKQKKFNRAYQRFMLGCNFAGEYRLITLTTPESFTGDIHNAWRKWIMRMRRRGLAREYFAVKEWNANKTCIHIHAVLRLDYISYQIARGQWKAVTGACWIQVEKVFSGKGMANYLGKYLNKGYEENPGKRGYWYAYEWIHRKWHAFSKEMYKFGECVTQTEFELIHSLNPEDRLKYMNQRMICACTHAIRMGLIPEGTYKLRQF
ncbi:MAG: hypothetical protein A9183_06250 [Dehalococcoides mccartyi]|uniref:rolling circle replication-associated protein n=1 Tax=Dehalococcoides mccartyi TaxID=61435 RepID=UPI0008058319|nr:hypothetical protein [Dehalococcoides mccartyi]MBF4483023.1 hypothetical protein [Dehalococcoides mccartyi]MBJ7531977.1 hypothetical protein [Dehalococcoides mccartyi]OBW63429.1 MAG: hypothetical protein A9183_06250 [Dehalococcoides mccartyi]